MFDIIKNAPPPPSKGEARRVYDFSLLEVKDAFDAPRDMGKTKGGADARRASISCAARQWAKRHNPTAKFTVRLYDEHTVRCHRIA